MDRLAPTVLILGGFLTSPPFYRPMRSRLLGRGAAAVVVAGIWTHDWLLAGVRGLGPIVNRAARDVAIARSVSAAHPASRGAPLLVIGHSAGGIVGRLLTSEAPFAGRRHGLADEIGALVTLGSPHNVGTSRSIGGRIDDVAGRFANQAVPGAAFAPRVGYVTVASRAVRGRPDGHGRERVASRLYRNIEAGPDPGHAEGDGLVPVESALLAGARQIVLEDVVHGQAAGQPWYGTQQGLDGWWDDAVAAWREALRARVAGPPASR